jgi:hypothetical protein
MRVPTTDTTFITDYFPTDPPTDYIYVHDVLNLLDRLEVIDSVGASDTFLVQDPILVSSQVSKVSIIGTKLVSGITQDTTAVVTVTNYSDLNDGDSVVLNNVGGMYEVNGLTYYAKVSGYLQNQFALYEDEGLTTPLDSSAFNAYTSGGTFEIDRNATYVPNSYNSILVDKTFDLATPVLITVYIGTMCVINGEYITFKYFSTTKGNNSISGLTRGVGGTIVNTSFPRGSIVRSVLPSNILNSGYYATSWNDARNNPLQVSETPPAEFLRRGYE